MAGTVSVEGDKTKVRELLQLAHDKSAHSRQILLENISDMFLSPEGRLSERERSLMGGILSQLIHEVEMTVRRDLAERLAKEQDAPHDLIVALANDEISIAHPILHESGVLKDVDLIEIVKHRTREHRQTVAMREPLSEEVAQAIVETGEADVIEALLNNHDAEISRRAMDYLVAESERVDSFQQPLLRRPDLPVDLAHRMFWWVSAALREHVLANFKVDEATLDSLIHQSTTEAKRRPSTHRSSYGDAQILIAELADRGQLDQKFLVQCLRRGRIAAFTAAFAQLAGVEIDLVRRVIFDPGGEGLAVLCQGSGVDRATFSSIFLLTREARDGSRVTDPGVLNKMLKIYDSLSESEARGVLGCWQLDSEYVEAGDRIRASQGAVQRGNEPLPKPSPAG